jgi:CO/xanthine dehydrogenase Mo-binding subunit/xanthine dehydrogenase iron-sulfur cluster and FAD-binding subunit A
MWKTVSRPATLDAALRELRDAPVRTRLVAGGTDLIVEQQRGVRPAEHLIDLSGIWELRYVRQDGDVVRIGALATHNDVLREHDLRDALLPLAQACIEVGAPQIRARATIAGNLVTASPANDTIAPLIALGAEVVLASAGGARTVALEDFYTGFRSTVLRPDEIVREIRFPALDVERRGIFLKLGLRRAQAISVINVAVVLRFDGLKIEEASIALGCVGPTIVRAPEAEGVLVGNTLGAATIEHAAELALEAIAPINDLRGSADYRRRTVRALVRQALETLADGSEADAFPEDPVLLETEAPVRAPLDFNGLIEATVNGQPCTLANAQNTTLLNALRDYGLTGSKEGCAEGECGACTVWLDGQAVMSCLVPAAQAHGAQITTIEGLSDGAKLHPLQQAYIDRGSVQCGFCIPGMLMAGAKLMEERATPTLDDAQVAISGNLCRCTGYRKILDAMDDTVVKLEKPRPDALDKVTGAAMYPADLVQPGMLHAAAVFAHRAHARIVRIDPSKALALDGVQAVLTAKDVPFNRFGLIEADQPLLCEDLVRFWGDRIALVVAGTAELARAGAARVAVEYEELPPLTDPRRAIEPGAPRVHADRENVLLRQKIVHGPHVDEALASADVVLEATFTTGWQEHAYLQPDAAISYWEDDRLVVETAGQWLHEDRRQLAALFALHEDDVIVRYAKVGGAFGGREDLSITPLAALAAWKLKRPVAMAWTRDESIIGHHKRHPFHITTTWGAMRDGRLVAAKTTMIADGGAYASTSVEVLKCAATFATGPYRVESVETDACVTYTNNVPSGAFRGFGSPQAHFAAETMVTRLAEALEMDPIEMRRKNLYREGDVEPTGEKLPEGVSAQAVFERCLQEVANRFSRRSFETSTSDIIKRGIGIACGMKNIGYSFGFPDQATATVELSVAGETLRGASVAIGAAEVGQGSHTILQQIAASVLKLDPKFVRMIVDDTSLAPNAGSASASRMTLFGGRAVKDACEAALHAWKSGHPPRATVQYLPGGTTALDPQTGRAIPHFAYAYAAQAVDVEVDTRTGIVRVLRVISVHDVGRAINRQLVEGQIEGCLAQAVGYTLTENFISTDGKIETPHFSTYLLPTALDMPAEIYPVILENPDPNGPFGARGVAELPLIPFAPAVAAAIHDATGAWVSDLPMTPERVLHALDQVRNLDQVEIGVAHVNGADWALRTGLGNGTKHNGDAVSAQGLDNGLERHRGQEAEIT